MAAATANKRVFRVLSYRGIPLEQIVTMSLDEQIALLPARMRRKFARGNIHKEKLERFMAKLRKAKANVPTGSRPRAVRTHYRNMTVLPEMVGSIIGVYNGKVFMNVEIKPDMIGHYLGEFAITYKPTTHGKYGATINALTNAKFYKADYNA